MKLLLTAIHIEESPRAVPLGPAMLASSIKRHLTDQVETRILDLYSNMSAEDCAKAILEEAPDAVGFSMYVWNRNLALETAKIIKQKTPGIILFAGGPEITAEDSLSDKSDLDFTITGEAELSIVEAAEKLLKDEIPKSGTLQSSTAPDLSQVPSPFIDGTLTPQEYSGMIWELSRGCPFKCDFCYESRGTSGIRRFNLDRLRSELRIFEKAKVEQIFVLDPTFNYNRNLAKELLKMMIDEAPEIFYFFEVRSEFIDREMAELFASLPCSLQIGMQSASDKVLTNINRAIDRDDFSEKVLLLHQAGVGYGFDLIYGLPGDTFKGFCSSLDYAMGLAPNHIDIFPLSVLPGTRLHETAPSFGLNHLKENPYTVLSTPQFNDESMRAAAGLAEAFDIFYNKGKAVPWFALISTFTGLSPSAFFKKFAKWLKTDRSSNIVDMQRAFVEKLLNKQLKSSLIPVASDLITYFGALECVSDDSVFNFHYSPDSLLNALDSGATDLEELNRLLPKQKCTLAIDDLFDYAS